MSWTEKTEQVIDLLSEEPLLENFVMAGGSALSYYLNHRLSEDIDLFTPDEILPNHSINLVMKSFKKKHSVKEADFLNSRIGLIMNIYFLDNIKIDFTALGKDIILKDRVNYKNNLYIAAEKIVIPMKMETIGERDLFRDYYDMYSLLKKYPMDNLIKTAKDYDEDFNYKLFFRKLINMDNVKENVLDSRLRPIYNVNKKELVEYFTETIQQYLSNKIYIENHILDNTSQLQKYASAYRTSGLEAALKQLKDDKKNANWIMHYRDKIFPDRTLTEVEKAVKALEKNKGMER